MKNTIFIFALTTVIAFMLAGCAQDDQPEPEETVEETRSKIAETWDEITEYSADWLEQFTDRLEHTAEQMSNRVSEWRRENEDIPAEAITRFEQAQNNLQDQLEKAEEVGEENWEKFKDNLQQAWQDVQEAYAEMRDQLADD